MLNFSLALNRQQRDVVTFEQAYIASSVELGSLAPTVTGVFVVDVAIDVDVKVAVVVDAFATPESSGELPPLSLLFSSPDLFSSSSSSRLSSLLIELLTSLLPRLLLIKLLPVVSSRLLLPLDETEDDVADVVQTVVLVSKEHEVAVGVVHDCIFR